MPGDRLDTHAAAQTADHAAEAMCEATPLVNKFTVLQSPRMLADKRLRQLDLGYA